MALAVERATARERLQSISSTDLWRLTYMVRRRNATNAAITLTISLSSRREFHVLVILIRSIKRKFCSY